LEFTAGIEDALRKGVFVEMSYRSLFTFVLFCDDAPDELYQRIGDGLAWVIVGTPTGACGGDRYKIYLIYNKLR